jgi:6-phosphogluconolactonase
MPAHPTRTYFGTNQSEGIYSAELDSDTGQLSAITLATTIDSPGFLAIHPNQQYLYAAIAGFEPPNSGGVAAFRINDDGSLSRLNTQPSLGRDTCHLSVDATGQTLVTASYSNGTVSAFKILKNGTLAPASSTHQHTGSALHPWRQKSPHPHSAFIHPNNQYVYVPDLGIDKIICYSLDAEHAILTESGFAEVPGGSQGPRHMKFSRDGKHAYVLNEITPSVALYSVNPNNGQLDYIETQSVFTESDTIEDMGAAEIRIHPSEQWIYTSTRDLKGEARDTISTFSRAQDGTIKLIANTAASVNFPRNFNITPNGKWLIVGGQKSEDLAIFSIAPDSGALSLIQNAIPFNGQPICIEFLKE